MYKLLEQNLSGQLNCHLHTKPLSHGLKHYSCILTLQWHSVLYKL